MIISVYFFLSSPAVWNCQPLICSALSAGFPAAHLLYNIANLCSEAIGKQCFLFKILKWIIAEGLSESMTSAS